MTSRARGKVYLVGAGPGTPDLLTLRALRAIRESHVILCDALLPDSFLADAGIPLAGKEIIRLPRHHDADQPGINESLLRIASEGRIVTRLKNGDPFIFGRGFEEARFLSERGVDFEVVPGLSSGIAGPAGAGLALTRRGEGRSVAFVTAVEAGGRDAADFPRADTLVVFMAVERLDAVAARMIAQGWAPTTPCVVIERAGLPWERDLRASLSDVATAARAAELASPALLVVGRGAERRVGDPQWPTVLFTGLDATNHRHLGRILHWPALSVESDPDGVARVPQVVRDLRSSAFSDAVFTSRIGVGSFFAALADSKSDARALAPCRVIAAGGGTALRLRDFGVRADAAGDPGGSDGIISALGNPSRRRILLVQGTHAPNGLEDRLRAAGADVLRLALHRVLPNPELGRPLPEHDAIYFLSPSGVRAYFNAYGVAAFRRQVWCIGSVTRDALIQLGAPAPSVVEPPAHAST